MKTPDLKVSGGRLAVLDTAMVRLIAKRMRIAQEVGEYKEIHEDPIYRASVENTRLNAIESIALEEGLNPHFARQFLYNVIGEACKIQMVQTQGEDKQYILPKDPDERYDVHKRRLIELTEAVASRYYRSGGNSYPATEMYVRFEDEHILKQVKEIPIDRRSVAVDLGCAAGRVSRLLSPNFKSVIGFDLSQRMVIEATNRADSVSDLTNMEFIQKDLEEGIPLEDNSVDFLVMGLGTASDIRGIKSLLKEVGRVLRPDGRFLLSFYNKGALIYTQGHVSLDASLAAEINVDKECLTVHVPGYIDDSDTYVPGTDYLVYARAYEWGEIESLVMSPLRIHTEVSFPVTATVIPRSTLEKNEQLRDLIEKQDRSLAYATTGAYWVIGGVCDF